MSRTVVVHEVFYSIQGETSTSGLPTVFIRLTGCNLRCTYCDTTEAFYGGERHTIASLIDRVATFQTKFVTITGGEPLLQNNVFELLRELSEASYQLQVETHGQTPIEDAMRYSRLILDVKTPLSGEMAEGERLAIQQRNLSLLREKDEIKFVIAGKEDFDFARETLPHLPPRVPVLFSPAHLDEFNPRWLVEQILHHRLNVRFQTQLHKVIWGSHCSGV